MGDTSTTTNEQLFMEGKYEELFERNTDFIWHVYKQYRNICIEQDEYFSLCCLAFTRSLKGYDPKVAMFVSYWGTAINREMLNYLRSFKRKEKYRLEFLSLDAPMGEGDCTLQGVIPGQSNVIDDFLDTLDNEIIKNCIKKLTRTQTKVYELYLQGLTQKDIADKLNVTRSAVGKAIKNGKATLVRELRNEGICF